MSMTNEELEAFLAEPRMAHLATVDAAGKPRVRPVWYLWRDGAMWILTRLHRHTGRDVADNPAVAVSVASDERPYRAVIVRGTAEILERDEQVMLDIATRYGEEEGREFVRDRAMVEEGRVILKIVPSAVVSWDYGKD
jgi:PPOX class probable F420-dependent enzyme